MLGNFHFLCILLAMSYPVWEFQEHLRLSLAQPHMYEPPGVGGGHVPTCPRPVISPELCSLTCRDPPPGLKPEARTPTRLSSREKRCGSKGPCSQPESSNQTEGRFFRSPLPGRPLRTSFCVAKARGGQVERSEVRLSSRPSEEAQASACSVSGNSDGLCSDQKVTRWAISTPNARNSHSQQPDIFPCFPGPQPVSQGNTAPTIV